MADNLVSSISRYLTPDLVGKMATAAGVDPASAQKAVDALVPTILGSFANVASDPGGARQLANAVEEQPAGITGNLGSAITSSPDIAAKGVGQLGSLLGSNGLGAVASGISRIAGVSEGSAKTLAGLVTPAVLGVLGREQRAGGLDASGLGRMLASQKDAISAAMPAGLAGMLKTVDLRGAMDAARTQTYAAPAAAMDAGRNAAASANAAAAAAKARSGGVSWPLWLLPLLALAGLIWYMNPGEHMTQQASAPPSSPTALTADSYIASNNGDWTSVGTYHNEDVYNSGGEKVGTVTDVLIDKNGRKAALISVGQFLGIGEKTVAVPFDSLRKDSSVGSQRLVINAAKESLQAAPAFQPANASGRTVPKLFPADPAKQR